MLNRIFAENTFVTRIKTNTQYQCVEELDLPDEINQDILKDEIIILTGVKAAKTKINEHKLSLVSVYKKDENKTIYIITNNLAGQQEPLQIYIKKDEILKYFSKQLNKIYK